MTTGSRELEGPLGTKREDSVALALAELSLVERERQAEERRLLQEARAAEEARAARARAEEEQRRREEEQRRRETEARDRERLREETAAADRRVQELREELDVARRVQRGLAERLAAAPGLSRDRSFGLGGVLGAVLVAVFAALTWPAPAAPHHCSAPTACSTPAPIAALAPAPVDPPTSSAAPTPAPRPPSRRPQRLAASPHATGSTGELLQQAKTCGDDPLCGIPTARPLRR